MELYFIIYSLAVWRLSSLLANESAPFEILDKLRYMIGVRFDEHSRAYGLNVLAKGVICIWCNSIWIGLLWTILYVKIDIALLFIISLPLALSAVAIIIEKIINE